MLKGGYINLPTMISSIRKEPECSVNNANLEPIEDIKKSKNFHPLLPLYNLRIFLINTCNITIYALDDYEGNHICFEPNIVNDEDTITHIQILNTMQIQIHGDKKVKDYKKEKNGNIYNFNRFLSETYNLTSDKYPFLIEYTYFHKKNIAHTLYRRSVKDFLCDTDGFTYKYNVNMINFRNFITKFFRIIDLGENHDIPGERFFNLEYHTNYNIVYIFSFLNKINELYDIVDEDYNMADINSLKIPLQGADLRKVNIFKNMQLNKNSIHEIILSAIGQKSPDEQIDYINNLDLLPNLCYSLFDSHEPEKLDELIKYYKLEKELKECMINNINDIPEKHNKLTSYLDDHKNIKELVYHINAVKIIKKININDNINLICNTYNYIIAGNIYRQYNNAITNKIGNESDYINNIIKQIYKKTKVSVYIDFIKEISKFLDDLNKIRSDFVNHTIYNYKGHVKLIIGLCYYNILTNNSSLLPISLYTHLLKYKKIYTKIDDNIKLDLFTDSAFNFILTRQKDIFVQGRKFISCGETNLMNFIRYILFDTKQNIITKENIDKFNTIYPNNILKEFFTDEFLKLNNEDQTNYLESKVDKFASLVASDKEDTQLYYNKTCELNPSLINTMIILFNKLLNTDIQITKENVIEHITRLSELFEKNIISYKHDIHSKIANDLNYSYLEYENIKFNYAHGHGQTDLKQVIKYKNDNTFNIYLKRGLSRTQQLFVLENDSIGLPPGVFNDFGLEIYDTDFKEFLIKILNKTIKYVKLCIFNKIIESNSIAYVPVILFHDTFNGEIDVNAMPHTEEIIMTQDSYFNKEIKRGAFPNLIKIIINGGFNQNIKEGTFPKLKTCKLLSRYFNSVIEINSMPVVENVTLPCNFNKDIKTGLFPKLKEIEFGFNFNSIIELNSMPNVEIITFNSSFNQDIKSGLFPNLKKIKFGDKFNGIIELNSMPNIEEIHLPSKYQHTLDENAIPNIKIIKIGYKIAFNRTTNIYDEKYDNIIKNLKKYLPQQTGSGYYTKYLKYKQKYMALKNSKQFT
jgi:hypothetical protein